MSGFIVVYDDGEGLCGPYGWDDDCEGAICFWSGHPHPVALFESRQAARTAINISRQFAKLCKAQGKPENTDFTIGATRIKILPLAKEVQS